MSAPDRPDYGPDLIDRSPCDTGPPCLCRDVQSFAIWAERRRVGPGPGALLALAFVWKKKMIISVIILIGVEIWSKKTIF